ncbi:MAG: hypothetical protein ACLRMZ_09265 [Blautia marasmi]
MIEGVLEIMVMKGECDLLRKEWKGLVRNKLLLVVVVAIVLIPTIYTTLFWGLCGILMEIWISCRWRW